MTGAWKVVGVLLVFMTASCSPVSFLTKKDKDPDASRRGQTHERSLPAVQQVALGDLPPEAELCSLSADKNHCISPSDNAEIRSKVADIFSGTRHPRIPDLTFPVPSGVLSSPFGYRRGVFHSGLDVAAPRGEPVIASADGQVVATGSRKGFRSYGLTVLIDHGRDVCTHYAHLSKILVKKGEKVRQGQIIARVGNTGRTTRPHLHFEVKIGKKFFNPYIHFAPSEVRNIEVAKGFNLTPMGPVRARRAFSHR